MFPCWGLIGVIECGYHDSVNVTHHVLSTNHPPLGGSCGTTLPFEFGGGEIVGLFCPSPPLVITFVDLCCVMVGICALSGTCITTCIWVVGINGHTPSSIRCHYIPHGHR